MDWLMKVFQNIEMLPVLLMKLENQYYRARAEKIADLLTADHEVLSEGCESRNTITGTPWWYKTSLLDGFKLIGAKPKLLREQKIACKSSWNPRGNQKSFTLTILWNSAKLVKISPGIIVRLHHTDLRLMVLMREQCAQQRKAPLLYCCNGI